jgi:hypothetical protein
VAWISGRIPRLLDPRRNDGRIGRESERCRTRNLPVKVSLTSEGLPNWKWHETNGILVRHGAKHDWYQNPRTKISQPVPRHREIKNLEVRFLFGKDFGSLELPRRFACTRILKYDVPRIYRIHTEKAFKNPCFSVLVRRRIRVQKILITAIPNGLFYFKAGRYFSCRQAM